MDQPRTPSWQMTRTSRQGFWLAGFFVVIGVGNWLLALDDGSTLSVVLAAGWTALTLVLVVSSVALRRRESGR